MNSSSSPQLGFGFDDDAVPQPATKTRRRSTATPAPAAPSTPAVPTATVALNVPPLEPATSLETSEPLPEVTPPSVASQPVQALSAESQPDTAATALTLAQAQSMAATLEQHPDFRVLRRLQPQLHFAGQASGPVLSVVLLDTETTGLNAQTDKVIELALLRFDLDLATGLPVGPVQLYDCLEDPGKPLSAEVQTLTGITDEMLRGQRLDEVRLAELLNGVDLVVAHNAGFDRPFVEARWPAFADLDWACSFADIDWKQEGRGSAKLTALAMELGWFYDAHRAEMDCHALLAVLLPPLPVSGQPGLLRLAQCAKQPSFRLQATGAPFEAKDELRARGYRWDATAKVWHTRLDNEEALHAETVWLKAQVYGPRAARVQIEQLTSRQKYAARSGLLSTRQL